MRLLLLSDTYSEHTEKWAIGLAERGIEVGLFSFNKASYNWYDRPRITVYFEPEQPINAESTLTKLSYLKYVSIVRKIIKHFKPDVLHAHYATSYGLVGALCGFHPYVISSWGTDVMKFPDKNIFARGILKYNFRNADVLCATSKTIQEYIGRVTNKKVEVIPFGVDTKVFSPAPVQSPFSNTEFVMATIKPLEPIYNINLAIQALASMHKQYPQLRLMIIGSGTQEKSLKEMAEGLGVSDKVMFTGRVPFEEVSRYFNISHVLLNLSQYESFGVSVIEAMACGKPVIVSDTGGLAEIVENESLGIKVKPGDETALKNAIESLLTDTKRYNEMSQAGRAHVLAHYNWQENLQQMINIYEQLVPEKKTRLA